MATKTKKNATTTKRCSPADTACELDAKYVARHILGIETLAAQHSDRLDFHDLGVERIADALRAAWERGRAYRIEQDGR